MDLFNFENIKNIFSKKRFKVTTPTILQMEAVECGAASLAMILGYYGRWVPLEQLRIDCGVSRDGSKASRVLQAGRKYGLISKGYRKDLDELKDLKFPVILFWQFSHFLVLEGYDDEYYYVSDPASGKRRISQQEMDKSYTGVVLCFEPSTEFSKGGEKNTILKGLFKRMLGLRSSLTYIILLGLFLVIPGIIIPVFSKVFIDQILILGLMDWFRPLIVAMIITVILQVFISWIQQKYLLRMETKIAITQSSKFFWHVIRLPLEFFNQRYAGDIGNRIQMNDMVAQIISSKLTGVAINFVLIIFYIIIMFFYDFWLTVISIFLGAVNIFVLFRNSRKVVDYNMELTNEQSKLIGYSVAGFSNIETLKSSGSENDFFSSWSGQLTKAKNTQQRIDMLSLGVTLIPTIITQLSTVIILGIGCFKIMDGLLTVGSLVAFQSFLMNMMNPINQVVELAIQLQFLKANMAKIDDVIAYPEDTHFSEKDQDSSSKASASIKIFDNKTKLDGYLEIKNLSFGYSLLEPPLIENFNMILKPGSRVAIVGKSGSGKSTITKLIMGLYKPWSGDILFDSYSRNKIPNIILTNSLAMVDQDVFLFEGTVKENLSMWNPFTLDYNIIQAAKDSLIHDVISSRTMGYNSKIAEMGRNFSGGEKQRLEIARALTNNPSILVLDEATSALDPSTEKMIDDNLRKRGCTCVIVAHRLSTIRDCDEIIVMEMGKIVQRGTHDDLKSIEGPYAELIANE